MSDTNDRWAAGASYEGYMGRWSRELAPRFVAWLGVRAGAHWLEVGCGTGALTGAIVRDAAPASVVACDPSESFVDFARRGLDGANVRFVVAGAGALPAREGGWDSVTSSLALNFFPDPAAAVAEMRTLAARGGTVSALVWDYAEGMEFLRRFWDAARAVDTAATALDEGLRFPLCQREPLAALFTGAGLAGVACEGLEIPTAFASFAEYWASFQGGTGPAPAYVAALPVAKRQALAAHLQRTLPAGADGAIRLTARAWAARGVVA